MKRDLIIYDWVELWIDEFLHIECPLVALTVDALVHVDVKFGNLEASVDRKERDSVTHTFDDSAPEEIDQCFGLIFNLIQVRNLEYPGLFLRPLLALDHHLLTHPLQRELLLALVDIHPEILLNFLYLSNSELFSSDHAIDQCLKPKGKGGVNSKGGFLWL